VDQKYSLAHLTVLACPPPEAIYVAARAGYDSASLRTMPLGLPGEPDYELSRNPEMLRRTKAALDATGLSINDIELCRIVPDMNPREYEPAFEVGAALGAGHVICSIWSADRSYSLDMFEQVCSIAAPYGLTIDLEYVCIASLHTLAGAVDVLATTSADNVGLLLDLYHVHRAGTVPDELDGLPEKWFNFCHLCDAPAEIPGKIDELREEVRDGRLYVGEGDINVADILNHAPEMLYSIELPNRARRDQYGNMEHAARALESAKKYFAGQPPPVLA